MTGKIIISLGRLVSFTLFFLGISFYSHAQALNKGPKKVTNNDQSPMTQKADDYSPVYRDTIYKDPQTNVYMKKMWHENGTVTIMVLPPPVGERTPINMDTIDKSQIVVVVDKSEYLLYILHKKKRIRQYRAVFGPDRMRDKHNAGDRCTPEGWFKIIAIRDHKAWQKFMLLDYPTSESYERFSERKRKGLVPPNAGIGSAIGIHGTFRGGEGMVDNGFGWTDGCVALKPSDIYDLNKFVQVGTRVFIRNPRAESKLIQTQK